MRHYKVNGLSHTVYEEEAELPANILNNITNDIKKAKVGQWIEAHDGCYMEVLRAGELNKAKGKNKSSELIKYTRIRKAMKKELEPILEKLGITQESILEGIKAVADLSEKDDTKLKALFKLSDILDLEDKSTAKLTQLTGIQFQGFSDKQLEDVERPKEIESG